MGRERGSFAPCPVLPFAREKARQLVSVIVLGVTLAGDQQNRNGSSEQWGVSVSVPTGFYPKKGGVESITAGCNGGRCLVVPCERIGVGEWAVRVPPVGQRRLR
eukprot:scaffold267_cov131-Isochrysis_galbana.AAC.5